MDIQQASRFFFKQKSAWPSGENGVRITQEAWVEGDDYHPTKRIKLYHHPKYGPIKVYQLEDGSIFGYPLNTQQTSWSFDGLIDFDLITAIQILRNNPFAFNFLLGNFELLKFCESFWIELFAKNDIKLTGLSDLNYSTCWTFFTKEKIKIQISIIAPFAKIEFCDDVRMVLKITEILEKQSYHVLDERQLNLSIPNVSLENTSSLVDVDMCLFEAYYRVESQEILRLKEKCELGNKKVCLKLGKMYQNGEGVIQDLSRAKEFYEKACRFGNSDACNRLAWIYQYGRGKKDLSKAIEFYQRACDLDDSIGCLELGWIYQYGEGVEQDDYKATQYFKKACKLGSVPGCASLGFMYQYGKGIEKDLSKAKKLYQKACKLGNGFACCNLALMYENGEGVIQDLSRAKELYERACDKFGNEIACNNLGLMYEHGKGVERDLHKAVEYFKEACNLENGSACNNLGRLYEQGKGVERDLAKAIEFYREACELGDQKGCENLQRCLKELEENQE